MKKLSLDELASELGFESSETDEALAEAWEQNWIICSYGDDVDPLGNEYLTPEKASEIAAVDSGLIYAYQPCQCGKIGGVPCVAGREVMAAHVSPSDRHTFVVLGHEGADTLSPAEYDSLELSAECAEHYGDEWTITRGCLESPSE